MGNPPFWEKFPNYVVFFKCTLYDIQKTTKLDGNDVLDPVLENIDIWHDSLVKKAKMATIIFLGTANFIYLYQ